MVAADFGKELQISGRHQIRTLDAFVGSLHFEAEQSMDDFRGTLPPKEPYGAGALRKDLRAVTLYQVCVSDRSP